jgi:hypothetical protein
MLRAAIASHPSVVEVPHDDNFVWKVGNYKKPHDELSAADLTPAGARFIRGFFGQFAPGVSPRRVVEKTVSNSLRVDFVRAVFPDAKLIHLIRDGRDVAESARRMWQAPIETGRILDKLRYFPLRALPTYAKDYALAYVGRHFSREQRVQSWGPRPVGLDEYARTHSLLATCGFQWRRSVESALTALDRVPPVHVLEVRYEALVANPEPTMASVMEFLDLDFPRVAREHARRRILDSNVGKWRTALDESERRELHGEIGERLRALGYES